MPKNQKGKKTKTMKTGIVPAVGTICKSKMMWLFLLIAVIIEAIIYFEYSREWEFSLVSEHLKQELFQQDDAINSLHVAIESVKKSEEATVIVIKGSVGVGKTVTASEIFLNFPWWYAKRMEPINNFNNGSLSYMLPLVWNLLILEDCDRTVKSDVILSINHALNLNVKKSGFKLLMILVCTINSAKEDLDLKKVLVPIEPYYEVPFITLDREGIKKCFLREISKMRVTVSEENLERLVSQHIKTIPEIGGTPGCKQIHTEILKLL